MRAESIFGPVSLLAIWTGCVLLLNGYRRIRGVLSGRLRAGAFKLGESADVPTEMVVVNRHFMNLLEMPVLFYVVCISLYVTHQVDEGTIWLSWLYVGLRLIHSLIHLTTNRVVHRLVPFALSNFVLLALWLVLIRRVLVA
ncbi:MAG TPA: MAPEG family protein [Polyangiaceae bacterium]|nr:MAPEG family protein [Polyangiaceae bacterium]